jgi:hypothetical protein
MGLFPKKIPGHDLPVQMRLEGPLIQVAVLTVVLLLKPLHGGIISGPFPGSYHTPPGGLPLP